MKLQCLKKIFVATIKASYLGMPSSRDRKFRRPPAVVSGKRVLEGNLSHARQCFQSFHDLAARNLLPLRYSLCGAWVRTMAKVQDHDVLGIETHVDILKKQETANHQAGANQQDDGESHLTDHQTGAKLAVPETRADAFSAAD